MARGDDPFGSLSGRKSSTGSRWRHSRIGPSVKQEEPLQVPSETKTLKLQSKSSRMSIFNLFSKPNVERARGHHEQGLPPPTRPQSPPSFSAPPPPPKSALRQSPPASAPTQQQQDTSKVQPLKNSSSKRTRQDTIFAPPPLFQAYPQAVKYATLHSSIASAESMVRIQQEQIKHLSLFKDSIGHKSQSDFTSNSEGKPTKLMSKRMSTSSTFNVSDFTTKIYMLMTTGYVLQYTGSGSFNRLPEKVLQLGPDSAAFASDMISGKKWVLQISQTAQEDGTVTANQRTLLSKLRLQNSNARRQASNFLLVLESAEDMESWQNALRKSIESLRGKERKSEAEARSYDEPPKEESSERLSHRFRLKRDPNRFSTQGSTTRSVSAASHLESPKIIASEWDTDNSTTTLNGSENGSVKSSRLSSVRHSADTSATTSSGAAQLNQLREGSRLSIMSTATSVSDTLTEATSHASTPDLSPTAEGFFKSETEPSRDPTSLKSFAMNPSFQGSRRRSVQMLLPTTDEDINDDAMPSAAPKRLNAFVEVSDHPAPSVNFNRTPRYQHGHSPEKRPSKNFRRSSSAPAPTIPLPPLPISEQGSERSLSPQPRISALPTLSSLNSRAMKTPTPETSPVSDEFPRQTVNFSRRRSAVPSNVSMLSQTFERTTSPSSTMSSPTGRDSKSYSPLTGSPSTTAGHERKSPSPPLKQSSPVVVATQKLSGPTTKMQPLLTARTTPSSDLEYLKNSLQRQQTAPAETGTYRPIMEDQAIFIPRRRQSAGRPPPLPVAVKAHRPQATQEPSSQPPNTQQPRRPISLQVRSGTAPFLSNNRSFERSAYASALSAPGPPPSASIGRLLSGPNVKSSYFRDNVLTNPMGQPPVRLHARASMPIMSFPPPKPPPNVPLPAPPRQVFT